VEPEIPGSGNFLPALNAGSTSIAFFLRKTAEPSFLLLSDRIFGEKQSIEIRDLLQVVKHLPKISRLGLPQSRGQSSRDCHENQDSTKCAMSPMAIDEHEKGGRIDI
jgi:hypothetical protein